MRLFHLERVVPITHAPMKFSRVFRERGSNQNLPMRRSAGTFLRVGPVETNPIGPRRK
jgi:hypothetical protein